MKRKSLIYKTGVEYGDYTLNHVQGCSHGCTYPCYAYMMAKRFGKVKNYQEWIVPDIVENALEILDKEIPKYKEKIEILHLCFTTDPFMYGNENVCDLTMDILKKANEAGVRCSILTKGLLPQQLTALPLENEYGISVVSLNKAFCDNFEPGAADVSDRINALKYISDCGCKTWVSIEPYPTPNIIKQDLLEIMNEIGFVDKIIFGRLHYNKIVSQYKDYKSYYNECAEQVKEFCIKNGIDYHIKNKTISNI